MKALAFNEHRGRGRLRAIVDSVMALVDGVEAQRRLSLGEQFGKIALMP